MRTRRPMLLIATTAVLTMSVAGCEARVYGAPPAASHMPRSSRDTSLVQAMMPPDDATARATITRAVKTMFPGGRI